MAERWIIVFERDARGRRITATAQARLGHRFEIGREGELPLAVAVPDTAISRLAAAVTATEHDWLVEVANRNGAVVHPWGQAPELARHRDSLAWPLIGIRMLPDSPAGEHWVLLEADDLSPAPAGPSTSRRGATRTDRAARPGDLPPGERQALQTVFADLLAWPPRHPAEPLLLKQAATRIGISISALQDRLRAARTRAQRLGLDRDVALTDPSYLHVLVRAGYLDPPKPLLHGLDGGAG